LKFDLRSYDISLTWIDENLDFLIVNAVRDWLCLPVSTCVAEMMSLPINKGGYGIQSLKHATEKMRVNLRSYQKNNKNNEIQTLWKVSSSK
jgi:hypothetical protein